MCKMDTIPRVDQISASSVERRQSAGRRPAVTLHSGLDPLSPALWDRARSTDCTYYRLEASQLDMGLRPGQ